MAALTANIPILRGNTQYEPGDILPTDDPALAGYWLAGGAAEYRDEPEETIKPKAKALTAMPGRTGAAYPSAGPDMDLVGRIPEPRARGIVKEPSKRPGEKPAG